MAWSNVCAWLEVSVMLFQVFGVTALCLNRLTPTSKWAERGRIGCIIAMLGLGLTGALCGRLDSEFGLFAGGTMTALLIGMTIGSGQVNPTSATHCLIAARPNLAA